MRLSYESLLRGDVEAAELFGPYGTAARENPDIRLLYDTAFEWRDLTGTWPMHHALAGYTDVLRRDPALPRNLVDAFMRSADHGQENLRGLMDRFAEQHAANAAALKAQKERPSLRRLYAWSLSEEDRRCIQAVLDMSLEFGFVGKPYTVDEVVFPYH